MPKVSVIIPVYNVEKYLRECLDSVVNQTLKDIEIICVDDGSTDSSLDILKEYAAKDDRFIIIEQENQGAGAARNKGLEVAQGEYLYFVDADDWVNIECLEKLYNKIVETSSDICIYGLIRYNEQTKEYNEENYYGLSIYLCRKNETCTYKEVKNAIFTRFETCLKMYKRQFFIENEISFGKCSLGEDVCPHIKALISAKKISFLDERLYVYRTNRPGSTMTSISLSENVLDVFKFINSVYMFLHEKGVYEELEYEFCMFALSQIKTYAIKLNNINIYEKYKQTFIDFINKSELFNIIKKYPDVMSLYQGLTTKISVIVPIYNVEKYLPKCLDSIINQTFKNIEIICVNDGSTDGSLKILENYANKDKRIKIISQENQGLPNARNTGLKEASGRYITFVDSDDWIDLNWLEAMYNAIISSNADIAKSGYKHYYPDEIKEDDINAIIYRAASSNALLNMNDNNIVVWATLYKTDFLKKKNILFFDNDILKHEDILYTLRATFFANKIVPVCDTYYNYRRETSILSSFNYSECSVIPKIHERAITFINNVSINKRDYVIAAKRIIWRTFDTLEKLNEFPEFSDDKFIFLKKIIKFLSQIKYKGETFVDYKDKLIKLDKKYINKYLQRNKADVLIVEYNNCHGECLPGYVNYFLELGYKVDVIISNKLALENPLNMFLNNANVYIDILNENEIIALLNSDRINEYKYCFLNSEIVYSKNKVIFDLIKVTSYKTKFICVCHRFENLKKLDKVSQPIILKSFKKYHNKYTVNPHYFGNNEKHSKNDLINFVVAGNIEKKRKNYDLLINTVERLLKNDITNFKITVIGKGDNLYLPEHIKSFFDIKGRLTYSNLYEEIKKADFFLTLLDPDNEAHFRYLTRGTSGSFQLINGFLVPAIIEKTFAEVHDYNTTNAIVYEGNDNLYEAMKYAISMNKISYLTLQENLEILSNKLHNNSLVNLQKILKDFSLKRYLYINLENIFSVKNDNIHKVITILGLKIKFKSKKLIKRKAGIKEVPYTFLENVFSVKNINIHKVITILGIKMKFKSQKLIERQRINNLENLIKKTLSELQEEKKNNQLNANKLKEQNIEIQKILKEQQEAFTQQSNELKSTQINMELRITNNIQDLNKKLDAFHDAQDQNKLTFTNNFQNIEKYLHNYIDNQNKNKNLYTIKSNFELERCKEFYEDIDKISYIKKYKALINNLDPESIECVSKILSRVEHAATKGLPMDVFDENEKKRLEILNKDFYPNILKLNDDCYAYQKYLLPIKHFESSVFYYKHNIDNLKDLIKIRNKNIIDAGGFIGDSAIILKDYTDKKVFSFEPTSENYELLLKTIEYNDCHEKIIPIKQALGSCEQELEINIQSSGSSINRIIQENPSKELIKVDTLDKFVKDNALDIGLIKVDIEGFEQEFINGALNTIKNQKPTLLISIYHFADDFFNIKPFIESLNLGYSFKVIKPIDGGIRGEILLICEQ